MWRIDGPRASSPAPGADVTDDAAAPAPGQRAAPATWPRSSTPRALPAGPRAASSPTATCWPQSERGARGPAGDVRDAGGSHAAVHAAGARVRPDHRDRLPGVRRHPRALGGHRHVSPTGCASSGPRSCSPCPGSSRRSTTPPSSRRRPARPRARSSPPRPARPSPTARRRTRAGPAAGLQLRHALFDRLVYAKLRAAVGGRVTYAVSGGAPLGERLGHFFRGAGITVLEGYGMTETSAAATVNKPGRNKIGTVGPAAARRQRQDRGRRRDPAARRHHLRRLLAERGGHQARRSTTTAGCTPATSARSTTRASCGSPAGRRS